MRDSARLGQLLSKRVTFSVVVITCLAVLIPLLAFVDSNNRWGLSMQGLTQTFCSPSTLSEESLAADRHFLLKDTRFSDAVMMDSRYGIFWQRVEYLLTSGQARVVQTLSIDGDSVEKVHLEQLSIGKLAIALTNDEPLHESLVRLYANWVQKCQKNNQLVINNLAGGETGYLSQQLYPDYDKPSRFGSALMTLLAGALLYLFLRWLI